MYCKIGKPLLLHPVLEQVLVNYDLFYPSLNKTRFNLEKTWNLQVYPETGWVCLFRRKCHEVLDFSRLA